MPQGLPEDTDLPGLLHAAEPGDGGQGRCHQTGQGAGLGGLGRREGPQQMIVTTHCLTPHLKMRCTASPLISRLILPQQSQLQGMPWTMQFRFKVGVFANFEAVWGFYSNFANITKWDPNIPHAQVLKEEPGHVGSQYKLTCIFAGKASDIVYTLKERRKTEDEGYVSFWGETDDMTAFDEIICRKKGLGYTEMEYKADIGLKGWKVMLTPFLYFPMTKLTEAAKNGCRDAARNIWGQAESE